MDPLFTYLNRIAGVLSVQGYIDDTTIAGTAQSLEWLDDVAQTYVFTDCRLCCGSTHLLQSMHCYSKSHAAHCH